MTFERFGAWIDGLSGLPVGSDAHRRARLVAWFAVICTCAELPYGVFFAAMGVPLLAASSFAFVGVFAVTLALLRRRQVEVAGGFLSANMGFQLALQAGFTGGIESPALWSMLVLAPMSQLTIGGRAGLWTALAVGAVAIGYGIRIQVGGPMGTVLPPSPIVDSSVVGVLGLVLVGYMSVYERIERRMRAVVEEQRASAEAAHRHARLVLDSVDQGFVMLDVAGRIQPGFSVAVTRLLGEVEDGAAFGEVLGRIDADLGETFALGWEAVGDGFLPLELTLGQLPRTVVSGGVVVSLTYRLVGAEGPDARFVVMVSDVTAEAARLRSETHQRELLALFLHLLRDRSAFVRFVQDMTRLVEGVVAGTDPVSARREVHTIKGNAGFFGLDSLVALCHALETAAADRSDGFTAAELRTLADAWAEILDRIAVLVDHREPPHVEIEREEYAAFLEALDRRTDHGRLAEAARRWRLERVRRPLGFLAEQVASVAERLGRGRIDVTVDDGGVRLEPGPWAPFWSSLVHVTRNAVDHGIEPAEERVARGKPEHGRIGLRARADQGRLVIEVSDDGRGVDWERIREAARRAGLPSDGPQDLERALFVDGLSSRTEVTTVSGRGVGMAAVAETSAALGGRIEVSSVPGGGTTTRFVFEGAIGG